MYLHCLKKVKLKKNLNRYIIKLQQISSLLNHKKIKLALETNLNVTDLKKFLVKK